jgi:hypothetical protein
MQQQQQQTPFSNGLPPLASTGSYQHSSGGNDNFKVVIRVRPPLPREKTDGVEFRSIV